MNGDELSLCNIDDLREIAKKRLPRPIFEYMSASKLFEGLICTVGDG